MSRRDARDIGFKLIFSYTFDKEENNDVLEEYLATVDADDGAYIREIYKGVVSHYDELLEEIGKYAEGYEAERIYKVDLAILLLAVYEIKFMNDIPFKVSVDEAVNIANKYSTGKSGKYINGILAKFKR
jgi:N utilization substance protein B